MYARYSAGPFFVVHWLAIALDLSLWRLTSSRRRKLLAEALCGDQSFCAVTGTFSPCANNERATGSEHMKLSTSRVHQAIEQMEQQGAFEGMFAIPDDNPAVPKLNEVFGEHTFFLDSEGLHIIEPTGSNGGKATEGQVVKLASWGDPSCTSLAPHRPEPTEITIALPAEDES
jgi:hypothetical protein